MEEGRRSGDAVLSYPCGNIIRGTGIAPPSPRRADAAADAAADGADFVRRPRKF